MRSGAHVHAGAPRLVVADNDVSHAVLHALRVRRRVHRAGRTEAVDDSQVRRRQRHLVDPTVGREREEPERIHRHIHATDDQMGIAVRGRDVAGPWHRFGEVARVPAAQPGLDQDDHQVAGGGVRDLRDGFTGFQLCHHELGDEPGDLVVVEGKFFDVDGRGGGQPG